MAILLQELKSQTSEPAAFL